MKRNTSSQILNYVALPVGLVDVANQEGWVRSLAYYLLAKNVYKNASIYNFSLRKLGSVLNINHVSARYHYNIWKKNGLVKLHSNNTLVFCGTKAQLLVAQRNEQNEKSYGRIIRIKMFSTIREQIMILQSRAVQKNVNRQARNIVKKRENLFNVVKAHSRKFLSKAEFKAYKKSMQYINAYYNGKIDNLKSDINNILLLSDNKIAELTQTSISYAKKLKKFINQQGILTTTKINGNVLTTKKMSLAQYNTAKCNSNAMDNTFYHNGHVYEFPKTMYSSSSISNYWINRLESL